MAQKKDKSLIWVFIHGASYLGAMILVFIPIISWDIVAVLIIVATVHLIIDMVKHFFLLEIVKKGKMSREMERNVFFLDQALHTICIIFIAYGMDLSHIVAREVINISDFFITIGICQQQLLSWFLALLIIHKPSNIAIQKLLMIYRPECKEEAKQGYRNAGKFIGSIERIIILIFLSIQEYAAIGLVLTAKSIARYDKISKEKNFAEYYLLGTLISTLIGIIVSFIL